MATLGLKEMGKFLWEGREKVLPSWLSQFSFALGVDAMPLSLKNLLLNKKNLLKSHLLKSKTYCAVPLWEDSVNKGQ